MPVETIYKHSLTVRQESDITLTRNHGNTAVSSGKVGCHGYLEKISRNKTGMRSTLMQFNKLTAPITSNRDFPLCFQDSRLKFKIQDIFIFYSTTIENIKKEPKVTPAFV